MTQILWAGGALLCLASLTLYGFGMNNPGPMRWAALVAFVSVAAVIWTWRGAPVRVGRAMLAGLAVLIYAAASLLWTPDWREGVLSLHSLVVLAGVFVIVQHADRKMLELWTPVVASAALLVSIVGGLAYPGTFGLMGNENFQAEFLLLLIPVALFGPVVWPERTIGALCFMAACLALFVLFTNGSHAKWAGVGGLGGMIALAATRKRRWTFLAVCVVAGGALLWLKIGGAWQSIIQRLELGHNTLLMWADRPLFGGGLGSFNYLYPSYQEAHIGVIPGRTLYGVTLYAGAAHNEYLQALSVFGLVGSALIALFLWFAVKDRRIDVPVSWAIVVLSILAGLAAVNFPLQNPATALIGTVALATIASPGRETVADLYVRLRARVRAFLRVRQFHTRRVPYHEHSCVAPAGQSAAGVRGGE